MKTSAIEGEYLEREDVMSSIRNNLNLNNPPVLNKDARTHGVARMMIDVRHSFLEPLSVDTLFTWHRMLFSHTEGISKNGPWRMANA